MDGENEKKKYDSRDRMDKDVKLTGVQCWMIKRALIKSKIPKDTQFPSKTNTNARSSKTKLVNVNRRVTKLTCPFLFSNFHMRSFVISV